MPMPKQLSLRFRIIKCTAVPTFIGSAVHGMFFTLLGHGDPSLADRLHHSAAKSAFSLDIADMQHCFTVPTNEGNTYVELRVGIGDDLEAARICDALLLSVGLNCALGGGRVSLLLETVTVLQTLTPDALESQVKAWGNCDAFTVTFRTPTVFRHDNHYFCLPQSDLLLGGISRKVLSLLPMDYAQHAPELYTGVLPDQFQLSTAPLPVQHIQNLANGVVGRCTYRILLEKDNPARLSLGRMLVLMPFYGIGIKTAMGMGAVEVARGGVK